MVIDDIRKTFDALIEQLTPAKAQELAKRYLEPGAAKEQVAKTAGELVQLSQRLRDTVRKEVSQQLHSMGAATQEELDALRKRVRDLERAAGMTASGRSSAGRKTAARERRTPSARKKSGAREGDDERSSEALERLLTGTAACPAAASMSSSCAVGSRGAEEEAHEAIRNGHVTVRGAPATKITTLVAGDEALAISGPARPFVSRGGQKLAAALDAFAIDPTGRDCLDAGASTGGFTDCLLQRGARHVVAVDVGCRPARLGAPNRPPRDGPREDGRPRRSLDGRCRTVPRS